MSLTAFLSLPWYTKVVLLMLGMALAGAMWHLSQGARRSVVRTAVALWNSFKTLLDALARRYVPALASHGTAHWCSTDELERTGALAPTGTLALASVQGQTLYEPRGGSIAIVAPTRSHKSWGFLMPNVRTYPGSIVCSDPRGELLRECHAARAAFGPVYAFNPGAPESCGINVFDLVRSTHTYADMHKIVHALVRPQMGAPFDLAAVSTLVAVGLHLLGTKQGSLPGVLAWMEEPGRTLEEKTEELRSSPQRHVARGGQRLRDRTENMARAAWDRATEALGVFRDDLVAAATAHSDFSLRQLHDTPTTLFMTMHFADVDRLSPLLNLLVDMLVQVLSQPRETPPRHDVTIVLDEMANLGRLSGLERGVSFLLGCRVRLVCAWQNIPQIHAVYGPESLLLPSMAGVVFYAPAATDLVTSRYISDSLGVMTTTTPGMHLSYGESASHSMGLPRGSMSQGTSASESISFSMQATARPLMTPDEVRTMPPETALVLLQGLSPIRAEKLGTLPLTRIQKAARAIRQQPSRLVLPIAAVLAFFALRPALPLILPPSASHQAEAPTTPQSAHASLFAPAAPASTTETPTATSTPATTEPPAPTQAPAPPAWHPPAQTGWRGDVQLVGVTHEVWRLQVSNPFLLPRTDGGKPTHTLASLGSRAACIFALHRAFEPEIQGLEKVQQRRDSAPPMASWIGVAPDPNPAHRLSVERSLERLRWETYNATMDRRDVSEAWCEKEEPAVKAPKSITSDLSPKGFKPLGQR
jgi:type IV secretory pathway TraG/TraD family ATPase VirD4